MAKIRAGIGLLLAFTTVPLSSLAGDRVGMHDRAIAHFMSPAEPKVKDALWTTPFILKLGVIDDGSSRDGYAAYACQELADMGFKGQGISVQIIDIVKVTREGKWVKLGQASCP